MRLVALVAAVAAVAGVAVWASLRGDGVDLGEPVAYAEVLDVFDRYGCAACHPGVNPALDLSPEQAYDELVGVRALADPTLYRVVAGDPARSFLYLKIGGDPPVGDVPAIGGRMPPRAPPMAEEDLDLVRRWIVQGARDEDGRTGGPEVPTPGTPPTGLDVAPATEVEGSGTIAGSVVDQRFEPIEGALVTMLLRGPDRPGGEEHYRVAVTGADGTFTLADAPAGRYLLKAYAPDTIYVSRIVALEEGERATVAFGLPDRAVGNPSISNPRVEGRRLSLTVEGRNLDPNYTLAVNPAAGLVFELHAPGERPGTWSATIDRDLGGPWVFLAVDTTCNVSDFLTAE